jgi:3-phosphoshikimate 1-carboxyvinyltransferase
VVPGDKSISHRALILGALAEGETCIRSLADGDDVRSTMRCLLALGVAVESEADQVVVDGTGSRGLAPPGEVLDAGNSGTTMRLLAGVLAGHPFNSEITGDDSLRRRPMKRVVEPLTRMGAHIESQPGGYPPLAIHGTSLKPITYELPVASAQVKSCVLLAGLLSSGSTTVIEPTPSRDHTERMLAAFGATITRDSHRITIRGGQRLEGREIPVPGDFSSAAFFLAAATIIPDSELVVRGVGLNPTRTGFLSVLREMGGDVEVLSHSVANNEPSGDLRVRFSRLRAVRVGGGTIPAIIDEIPILAVLATQAEGCTEIRDAGELRVKESDRIHAVVTGLRAMGGRVEELPDGMIIEGPSKLQAAEVDSYGDHRVAMAFAVAGLLCQSETVIRNARAVSVSFPRFFSLLEELVHA